MTRYRIKKKSNQIKIRKIKIDKIIIYLILRDI